MNGKTCKKQSKKCDVTTKTPYWIRHIDGNTLNNNVNNLQWVSSDDILKNPTWITDKGICDPTYF